MASRKEYELLMKLQAALGSNFNATFQTAMNATNSLQGKLQDLKRTQNDVSAYQKSEASVKALKEEKARLESATEKNEAAIDRVNAKLINEENRLAAVSDKLKAAGVDTNNLTGETERLEKAYNDLKTSTENLSRAQADLEKNKAAVAETSRELAKTIGVVAAAAAAVYAGAIKPAIEFESAMAGVFKTVDGTPEQLLEIQNGIRGLAKEIPLSTTEIAALSEAAGQLGVETQNVLGFTRVVADLGVATNIVGQEGAAQIARFANITGMAQTDFDRFGSSIVALGNNFASTESEILNMSMRLAGAGAQVGMSEADILGLATALSSVGIEAEMGGSAISKVLVNMSAAGATADKMNAILDESGMSLRDLQMLASHDGKAFGGLAESLGMTTTELRDLMKQGSNLENFARISGMTANEFRQAFEQDAVGALQSFIGGLGNAEDAGSSAIEMLQEMGISEVRLRDSLLRAAGAGDLLTNAVQMSNTAWEENIALANEAQQRYETTESKIQLMKNTLNDVGITIGDMLLPVVQKLIEKVSEVAEKVVTFVEENKELVATVAKVAAGLAAAKIAFLTVKLVVLKFVGVMHAIKTAKAAYVVMQTAMNSKTTLSNALQLKEVAITKTNAGAMIAAKAAIIAKTAAIKVASVATAAFNAIMAANPIALVVLAIAGLIAGIILLVKNWDKVKEAAQKVWEVIKDVFGKVKDFFIGVWEKIKEAPMKVFNWFKDNWKSVVLFILNPFAGIFKYLYDNFEGFRNFVDGIVEKIKAVFAAVVGWFNDKIIQPIIAAVKAVGKFFAGIGQWIFTNVIQPIINIFAPIVQKIGEIFAKLWEIITVLFGVLAGWFYDKVIKPTVDFFKTIIQTVGAIFQSLWDKITGIFANIVTWFSEKFTAAWEAVKAAFAAIGEFFTAAWAAVVAAFSAVVTWFSDKFTQAWEAIKAIFAPIGEFFGAAWNTITGVFSNVVGWFSEKFTAAWEAVKNVFASVGAFFQGIWDKIVSIFTSIGTTIGNAIGDAFKFVVNSVIGFAEGLINKFIGGINKAIDLINKIPGVNIEPLTLLNIPRLYKGSNYTPDTFVAGDIDGKGGELVTNAKGRKVFTAAQTSEIFKNIKAAQAINKNTPPDAQKATTVSAAKTTEIFNSIKTVKEISGAIPPAVSDSDTIKKPSFVERVGGVIGTLKNAAANRVEEMAQKPLPASIPSTQNNGGDTFKVEYNPTIHVDGNKPGDLDEKLRQHAETLLQMVREMQRKQKEDEGRMVYV